VVALAVAVLALAGCGGAEHEAAAPSTRVTVVVRPQGDPDHERRELIDCPGDARCARLRKADLSPPGGAVACTQVYGGRATALVTGRIDGRQVDADFDLHDGCAINRWKRFAWLLGEPPGG
jgi:hypothetical protein